MEATHAIEPKQTTLVLIYESWHVEQLIRDIRSGILNQDRLLVVSCSTDLDFALRRAGIRYAPLSDFFEDIPDQFGEEDRMMHAIFADKHWQSISYRDIVLVDTFRTAVRTYLQSVLYYVRALRSVFERVHGITVLHVYASAQQPSRLAGILAVREVSVVADVARLCAQAYGVTLELQDVVVRRDLVRRRLRNLMVYGTRTLFSSMLFVWNQCIGWLPKTSGPRLLISDYWRNVAPILRHLPQASCVFIDRSEIRAIPIVDVFRHRMRFEHKQGGGWLLAGTEGHRAVRALRERARQVHLGEPELQCGRVNILPLVATALDTIGEAFEPILSEIDAAFALMAQYSIELVLLRASVSAQTHFSVLALVARKQGIPSLEIQHGIEYLGPGSLSREHAAEYIATYGPHASRELTNIGLRPDRVVATGSPRFDGIAESMGSRQTRTIVCIAPDLRAYSLYDSYAAERYFRQVRYAFDRMPGYTLIIKMRAGYQLDAVMRTLIETVFEGVPLRIAQHESIKHLSKESSIAVSCFSTAALETLAAGVPTLLLANSLLDAHLIEHHFGAYEQAEALRICRSQEQLAGALGLLDDPSFVETQRDRAKQFLSTAFLFDGRAAERCAALILTLTRGTRHVS